MTILDTANTLSKVASCFSKVKTKVPSIVKQIQSVKVTEIDKARIVYKNKGESVKSYPKITRIILRLKKTVA